MRIVLVGANGQLGSDVLEANVRSSSPLDVIPVQRRDMDLRDIDSIDQHLSKLGFDALINCTGYHKTDDVERNATDAFVVNAHAVQAMAVMCRTVGATFVHISTDYVFDGRKSSPYVESDPIGPLNVYGASKAMGERLAMLANPETLVLRTASLYGVAGSSGKGGNFVETMIRVGRDKGELRVVADQTMSPTSSASLARMILLALRERVPPGMYHAVNAGQATWFEFARRIIQRAGISASVNPIASNEFPSVALRPSYSVLDNAKLTRIIGTVEPWDDALDAYLVVKGYRTVAS